MKPERILLGDGTTNGQAEAVTSRSTKADLISRLESRQARIGIIGLGYVGLPLALAYAERGFSTVGIDLDSNRVAQINNGKSPIEDINSDEIQRVVERGDLAATADGAATAEMDVLFICVPTPVTNHKTPDTSYIESATEAIASNLGAGQLVILKSTTYPNTTTDLVLPILKRAARSRDLTLGTDYFVAYSPERIDPGNRDFSTDNTPVVVGGVTRACTDVSAAALEQVTEEVHTVSNPQVAEMSKILENVFRSVNIALVNEMARMCDRMGNLSIWEAIEAATTKPFGYMPFYPGPGLGGHCIPVDPYFLSWLARKYDFETSFITLAARVNEEMPFYVRDAVVGAIADQPVSLRNARVLVLGAAFKANVDDTRHSPALSIIELLDKAGVAEVAFSDPHVDTIKVEMDARNKTFTSVDLTPDVVAGYDCAVLVTDHDAFPYRMIAQNARHIIDTRNAFAQRTGTGDNITVLGEGKIWS